MARLVGAARGRDGRRSSLAECRTVSADVMADVYEARVLWSGMHMMADMHATAAASADLGTKSVALSRLQTLIRISQRGRPEFDIFIESEQHLSHIMNTRADHSIYPPSPSSVTTT
jgi:hypothetical protein